MRQQHEDTSAQSEWLERARHQSAQLATTRSKTVPPFRGALTTRPMPTRATSPLRWAAAAVLGVLLGSGAWAVVRRPSVETLPAVDTLPATRPPPSTIASIVAPPVTPAAIAKQRRAKANKPVAAVTPAPTPPTGPVTFDEGDSTFIMVAPPPHLPPLFSIEEYKQRGLQKQK